MRKAERLVRQVKDSRGRYPGNNMWAMAGVGVVLRSQPVNPLPFSPLPGGGVAASLDTERIANPVISRRKRRTGSTLMGTLR